MEKVPKPKSGGSKPPPEPVKPEKTSLESAPAPPRKSGFHKSFFFAPTIDDTVMNHFRQQVAEAMEYEKMKKEKKRIKREKLKKREQARLDTLAGKIPPATGDEHAKPGSLPSLDESTFSTFSTRSENSESSQTSEISETSKTSQAETGSLHKSHKSNPSQASKEDDHYRKYLDHSTGPSHFSAQDKDQDLLQKYKEKKKRRISQLYTGEVYHHELTHIWDHLKDRSRFYDKLDEMTRLKYPISEDIAKRLDAIKKKKEAAAGAKKRAEDGSNPCYKRVGYRTKKALLKMFGKTNIGYVFKTTPRYYKMTPVTPIRCRRCRNLLADTLETRWTPLGISFAVLFPIFGILCCLSYREFVCVVCEEIYMYGDYPSRCRPLDKSKLTHESHVRFKKRSFNRRWSEV